MKICLDWHLGLGDIIMCNGLVRELAKLHEQVALPCYSHNLPSITAMFSDLVNVTIIEIPLNLYEASGTPVAQIDVIEFVKTYDLLDYTILSIGQNNPGFAGLCDGYDSFDRKFYKLAGVPFNCRWSSFHIPTFDDVTVPPKGFEFILLANNKSSGRQDVTIEADPNVTIILLEAESGKPYGIQEEQYGILNWIPWIAVAKEIHCVNSGPLHLVESVPTSGTLFYHHALGGFTLRKNWIVEYESDILMNEKRAHYRHPSLPR